MILAQSPALRSALKIRGIYFRVKVPPGYEPQILAMTRIEFSLKLTVS